MSSCHLSALDSQVDQELVARADEAERQVVLLKAKWEELGRVFQKA
jgi:hypothetical protein